MNPNLVRFLKYGFVGACGTLVHYIWLISFSNIYTDINPAYFAFSGAFIGAVVNYSLNYRFTFLSVKKHTLAFPQFVALAAFSMLASSIIVQTAVSLNIHYLIGQLSASALCYPIGFIISKKVVFNVQRH